MQGINDFSLVYFIAALAFLISVLFELWMRILRIKKFHQEIPLSHRLEKAVHYLIKNKQRAGITNDIYQELTKVSDATATRDLQKLKEFGFLEQRGSNKKTYYLFTVKAQEHGKSHSPPFP